MPKPPPSTEPSEGAALSATSEVYVFRLYVAGATLGSTRAVEALRATCDEHLHGRYEIEVVDVYQQPLLAVNDEILAVPTLVKRSPAPVLRIVGDLSNKQRVLLALDLKAKPDEKKRRTSKKP
jgi:circadian clock protein KaiB